MHRLMLTLVLLTAVSLAPSAASAFDFGDFLRRILGGSTYDGSTDGRLPAVPEPSGALVMGVALATVVAAQRRLRK